jgi:transglutaminase-like putative cysteine protease
VDLTGFDLEGGRQQLRGDTLLVAREDSAALRAAYRAPGDRAHRQRFRAALAPEPLIQSASWPIVSLATRIAGDERDPAAIARRVNRWVYDSLRKEYSVGVPSAAQVLQTRRGDCNEHTALFVALTRALGIPSRVAAGLAYVNGKFYYHAWPEVWLNGWVAVDPTFGEFPADAAHLRFVSGNLTRQAELLRLIGTLDVDVLEAR